METYVIIPRAGAYCIMAAETEGRRTLLATYPTEQAAIARLRALQEKAGVPQPDMFRLRPGSPR